MRFKTNLLAAGVILAAVRDWPSADVGDHHVGLDVHTGWHSISYCRHGSTGIGGDARRMRRG